MEVRMKCGTGVEGGGETGLPEAMTMGWNQHGTAGHKNGAVRTKVYERRNNSCVCVVPQTPVSRGGEG